MTRKLSEDDALAAALLWLNTAPPDDRLYDVDFGPYSDGSGCWWTMRLVTEVRNGEVQKSPENDERKHLAVIAAWRKAFGQSSTSTDGDRQ
jgi:hypothetical protein